MRLLGILFIAFFLGISAATTIYFPLLHKHFTARAMMRDLREVVARIDSEFDVSASKIECWGDSLTEGAYLAKGHDFPSLLRYLFRRDTLNKGIGGESSRQISQRMLARTAPNHAESAIIWAGRNDDLNDALQIESNIRAMIRSLTPGSRFLVLGIVNNDTAREHKGGDRYVRINQINQDLQSEYGSNYLPIREILVSHGRKNNSEDQEALENDIVPPSLRVDSVHLNEEGEAIVAYAIEDAIKNNGW